MNKNLFVTIILLCGFLFIGGCGFNNMAPPNNLPFMKINSLSDCNGIYNNLSDEMINPKSRRALVSDVLKHITTTEPYSGTEKIEFIIMKALNEDMLQIQLCDNKKKVLETIILKKGVDFHFVSGLLEFNSRCGVPLPIVGFVCVYPKIGLDTQKNLKYEKSLLGAGLFALIIPLFVQGKDEFRFRRVE